MIITKSKLIKLEACKDAIDKYFTERKQYEAKELFDLLMENKDYYYIRWGLSQFMTHKQRVEWSIYCAESCIDQCSEQQRPYAMDCIKSAKRWLRNQTEKNRLLVEASAMTWAMAEALRSAWASVSERASASAWASESAWAMASALVSARASALVSARASARASLMASVSSAWVSESVSAWAWAEASPEALARASALESSTEKLLRKGFKILIKENK